MPSKMVILEALLRRLPQEDPEYEYFQNLYKRVKLGYEGELRVDREWREIDILSEYYLLHNFESENEQGHSHQIDTIFLCQHFLLLVEIKNISGRIDFDQVKHQLIRTRFDGTIEGFHSPIDQIERHVRFVKKQLEKWDSSLPIEYAIVIAESSTVIGAVPSDVAVFHVSGLQVKLNKLFSAYPQPQIPKEKLELLKRQFLKQHQPKDWTLTIDKRKLRKGVLCQTCEYKYVMVFEYGYFVCPKCKCKSKEALLEALHDYRYLQNEWVTNNDLREYLGIDSRYAVNRLIKDLNLKYKGTFRDRKYFIPPNIREKALRKNWRRPKK